jgi:hypothetical protein
MFVVMMIMVVKDVIEYGVDVIEGLVKVLIIEV